MGALWLLATLGAGCQRGGCDTGYPEPEEVDLSRAEWDSIHESSGALKTHAALELCEEKLLTDDFGRYYLAEECGDLCLACSWEAPCHYQ